MNTESDTDDGNDLFSRSVFFSNAVVYCYNNTFIREDLVYYMKSKLFVVIMWKYPVEMYYIRKRGYG